MSLLEKAQDSSQPLSYRLENMMAYACVRGFTDPTEFANRNKLLADFIFEHGAVILAALRASEQS
jgi:hypothetical protein